MSDPKPQGLRTRHYYLKVSEGRHPGAAWAQGSLGGCGQVVGGSQSPKPEASRGAVGSVAVAEHVLGARGREESRMKWHRLIPVESWRAASERAVTGVTPGLRSLWKPSGLLALLLPRLRAPGHNPPSSARKAWAGGSIGAGPWFWLFCLPLPL